MCCHLMEFLKTFGEGIVERSNGISVKGDHIFITDWSLHSLPQFRKECELVRRTGTKGEGEGQLHFPHGLCIDYNGVVYVAWQIVQRRISIFSYDLTRT